MVKHEAKKWYKKWWGILLISVVILYFGSALVVRFFGSPETEQSASTQPTTSQNTTTEKSNDIPYEVVESWDIPDGNGQVIVIDPKYDNPSELEKLGKQIDDNNKSYSYAYVSVFTDKEAAKYRKTSFCALEPNSPIRKYSQNWAALYTKGTSGGEYAVWGSRDCTPNIENKVTKYPL